MNFFLTSGGSTRPLEAMRIDNAGLITGAGTSLGAWTAWTPTVGGTGWAIGNGVTEAAYCQIGNTVHFRIRVEWGTTSTFGAAAALTLQLPFAPRSGTLGLTGRAAGWAEDVSASQRFPIECQVGSTTTLTVRHASSPFALTSSTVPFAWASTDSVNLVGTYETF